MITFIVPAFNEQDNIGPTVESIRQAVADSRLDQYEVIVVNDGSSDETGGRVDALASRVEEVKALHHEVNQGLGSSIRSGIAAAAFPSFMVVPGDNDVTPQFIRTILTYRDVADMILTMPVNKELRSVGRNVLSTIYQLIYMVTFRVFVNYINGPGIWPTDRARQVALVSRRFNIISELNVKLLRSGCSYAEIPGYFRGGQDVRSTVTLQNLLEVIVSFAKLFIEVRISARSKFAGQPTRVVIEFERSGQDGTEREKA